MRRGFFVALLFATIATFASSAQDVCRYQPVLITDKGTVTVLPAPPAGQDYVLCSVGGRVSATVDVTLGGFTPAHQQTTGRPFSLPVGVRISGPVTITTSNNADVYGWITYRLVPSTAAPPPPVAVDCAVSAWGEWSAWVPSGLTGQETRTRTRTVVTPASNGGAACPALSETETRAVTPPPADSDGDGVLDGVDACPGTPQGTPVTSNGCPIVTPPPPVGGVHTVADIAYLGALRAAAGTDTTFTGGAMTGRIVNGKVRLFHYSRTGIVEVEVNATPNLNYRNAPTTTLIRNWGDVTHGKMQSWDPQGNPLNQPNAPSALYWNEETQLLYWGWYDVYGVSGNPDWSFGASRLNADGSSTAFGPWRPVVTDRDGKTWYGPRRCNWFYRELAGTMGCVGGQTSGNISNAWGPSLHGGIPFPTASTPGGFGAPDLVATTHGAEYYTMIGRINPDGSPIGPVRSWSLPLPYRRAYEFDEPLKQDVAPQFNGGRNTFSDMDGIGGCFALSTTGKASIVCTANLVGSTGDPNSCTTGAHRWYSTSLNGFKCSHGCTGVTNTGPVVNLENPNSMFPALLIFNPADLAAVNAGTKLDYSVDPQMIDLQATFKIQTAPVDLVGGNKNIKPGFFDPTTGRVYLISTQADNATPGIWTSLIHVFEIR